MNGCDAGGVIRGQRRSVETSSVDDEYGEAQSSAMVQPCCGGGGMVW